MRIHKLFPLISGIISAGMIIASCDKVDEPGTDPDTDDKEEQTPDPEKKSTCNLTSFILKGMQNGLDEDLEFEFDEETNTFSDMYLTWIETSDPEMMIPTFETDGERVLVNGSAIVSGETEISFAEDIEIIVEAENGDTQTYTVSLNCPQINTELPVLRLQPESEITSKDKYVDTDVTLYSPDTSEGWWSPEDGKVSVRGRGNSTWGLPKKPYRIKFPQKFSPIGLDHAKEKSWVILAHDMDKSLIRNDIGFAFSRIMFNESEGWHDPDAIMFTPCSQYINVYMNDKYNGVYEMSDQMERAKGRIAVDKLEASDGSDPDKITGGYIVETDIHEGNQYTNHGIKMSYKYPKDDDCDPAQYSYIKDFINEAEAALYGSGFKDPQNGWRKYLDEKTLVDFIIIKEFAGDLDGYTSTYMYKVRGKDKLFFGPIWDLDKGWNNDKRDPNYVGDTTKELMIYAGFYMPPYVNPDWFHRLWQDETLRASVKSRWDSKKDELTDMAMKILDEKPVQMAKAIKANFSVWEFYYQYSDEANMPAKTYEAEIERIRSLTKSRKATLNSLFSE